MRLRNPDLTHCYIPQVNLVLDDAIEYTPDGFGGLTRTALKSEILLNGNQIAVLVPGGAPPGDSLAAKAT